MSGHSSRRPRHAAARPAARPTSRSKRVGKVSPRPVIRPSFQALDSRHCERILARNHVGRLAFSLHDRVDIEPLHYIFMGEWLYGRTSIGSKLEAIAHNHWVAFEVDEVDGVFDWRSVVVRGGWYTQDASPPSESPQWDKAIRRLQRLVPGSLVDDDPVPFRRVLFRINVAEITGREATTVTRRRRSTEHS